MLDSLSIEASSPPLAPIVKKEDNIVGTVFEELTRGLAQIGGQIEFSLPDDFFRGGESYIAIKRNIYLTKRRPEDDGIFCACEPPNGSSTSCDGDCHCTMLFSCCSGNCKCNGTCANKPFQLRPIKKLKVVKTEKCGFGLVAEEDIKQGEFVIEYVGEVIDDKTCEERLWRMKRRGATNFYLCEVNSNMVIDATYKGNKSRFINHSCDPNTEMQKWRVEGETRVGIFALRDIKKGEDVTYDYMFVQFGADQDCHCGSLHCKEKLGRGGVDLMLIKRKRALTKDCIQSLIRVWRYSHRMWVEGYIYSYNDERRMHTIMYGDGSMEELDLGVQTWRFLPQIQNFRR
ncbi:histone-lysine N-methyltransferase [Rhynchospora pubera]|uniref:Histone-lysine N-methyltransferase n=1 Tax=Rhynchospora pubera TaxID=906938 RepID=A0AAV8FAS6_9POAL|nr:histone-lysine N-methyltransferase [Rhynchospora pubera]